MPGVREDLVVTGRPRFKGIDYLTFGDKDVVTTKLDDDCVDFGHLIGQVVLVDDIEFRCVGVQYPLSPNPAQLDRDFSLFAHSAAPDPSNSL